MQRRNVSWAVLLCIVLVQLPLEVLFPALMSSGPAFCQESSRVHAIRL